MVHGDRSAAVELAVGCNKAADDQAVVTSHLEMSVPSSSLTPITQFNG